VLRRGRAIILHCDGGLTEPGIPGDMTGRHDTMQVPLVFPAMCRRPCVTRLLFGRLGTPCLLSRAAIFFGGGVLICRIVMTIFEIIDIMPTLVNASMHHEVSHQEHGIAGIWIEVVTKIFLNDSSPASA
jgi:hypothetical protein